MKFCLINNLYPPFSRGGAEKIVQLIAEELLAGNHQVLLITSKPGGEPEREVLPNGLEILRIYPGNIYNLLDDFKQSSFKKIIWHVVDFFNSRFALRAIPAIKAFQPDFILTHNLKWLGMNLSRKLQKNNYKQVHTLHDFQLLEPHGSFFRFGQKNPCSNIFYQIYRAIARVCVGSPALVISPSAFVLSAHIKFNFFKLSNKQVLFNPIPTLKNESLIEKKPDRPFTVLFIGQLAKHKGAEFLTAVFKKFSCVAGERLLLVGAGDQMPALQQMAMNDSRVAVLGYKTQAELPEIFKQADLLVVPTLSLDNSPTVIYEAYTYGLPVLVSNSGGSKELVKENENGWVFASGNEQDLLAKLNSAFAARNNFSVMAEANREFIKNLQVKNYIERLLSLCRNLQN